MTKNTRKHHVQENQEVSPFPSGDPKAGINRKDSSAEQDQTRQNALSDQSFTVCLHSVFFKIGWSGK